MMSNDPMPRKRQRAEFVICVWPFLRHSAFGFRHSITLSFPPIFISAMSRSVRLPGTPFFQLRRQPLQPLDELFVPGLRPTDFDPVLNPGPEGYYGSTCQIIHCFQIKQPPIDHVTDHLEPDAELEDVELRFRRKRFNQSGGSSFRNLPEQFN